jgi:hypothetical protein
MVGDTVTIIRDVDTGKRDGMNAPIVTTTREDVSNVLISPSVGSDVEAAMRPDGVKVTYTLHFPKAWVQGSTAAPLDGCRIELPNGLGGTETGSVVGSPRPYQVQNTPTDWCMPVQVEVVNG